jgi:hypothetical protein
MTLCLTFYTQQQYVFVFLAISAEQIFMYALGTDPAANH